MRCYHCRKRQEDHNQGCSDWFYRNKLFQEGTAEIECLHCGEKFFVKVEFAPSYDTDIEENYNLPEDKP